MKYTNPIIKGFHPDPSICFDGKSYYIVCSSFEFFPCLPIFESQDLLNWHFKQYAIDCPDHINLKEISNSMGLFAPTIRFFEETYFLVCTNVTQGNFICHTKNLAHGWSDPIWIDCPFGIDPSISFIDGRFFFQLAASMKGKNSILQFEIDPYSGKMLTDPVEISQGCGGRDAEAPHLFKKDEWYYLVLAEGGTREGHMVTIQRSKSINGPYEGANTNPILSNRDIKSRLQAVGHADFFQDKKGSWWLTALATRPNRHFTLLGRETILLPVEWIDGWPVVNQTGNASVEVETDRFSKSVKQRNELVPFLCKKLQSVRLPIDYTYDTDLIIDNLPTRLGTSKDEPIAFLSLCQADTTCCFETTLMVDECQEGTFGIAIYKDDLHFCQFGLRKTKHQTELFGRKNIFDLLLYRSNNLKDRERLTLKLSGDSNSYHLLILDETNTVVFKDQITVRHFTNECSDSKFTGVQLGVFAEAATGKTRFITPELRYQ